MLMLRTTSARRYRIQGRLPSPYDDAFHQRLTDRRFLPLTAAEDRSFGWVTADNLLLTRFDADTVVRGEVAALGLRVDRRRVNPRLLRAQLDLEIEGRRKAAADAGRPFRLPRDERLQIKADLHAQLLRDTSPVVDAHTVLVHPKRRLLLVLSLTRRVNELVSVLVRDTFDVEISPLTPWRRSAEILAGRPQAERLDGVARTEFGSVREVLPAARRTLADAEVLG